VKQVDEAGQILLNISPVQVVVDERADIFLLLDEGAVVFFL